MRVGVLIDRHDPTRGGMERALAALVEHLTVRGHDARVYGLSASDDAPGTFRAIDVPSLPRGELERELAARSLAAARADGCDVTLAVRHAPEADVLWPHGGAHGSTLAAGERAKGGVAGSVSRVLHRVSPRHRAFLELERAALTGGARRVWCVSDLVRRELLAAYPGCAPVLEVHPNGVDRSRFQPGLRSLRGAAVRERWRVPRDTPLAVFPGGNLTLKGWPVLLRALRDTEWKCVATGVDVDDVRADARRAGVGERVIALPRQEMTDVLAAADLLVQPTFRDPCSLATLEALAAGVPVVTTDANGAADALTTDCGSIVPAGDDEALAQALRDWRERVGDPESRASIASAARAATSDRDAGAWLDGLVESLSRLA